MNTVQYPIRRILLLTGWLIFSFNRPLHAEVEDVPLLNKIEVSSLVYSAGSGSVNVTNSIDITDDNQYLRSATISISSGYHSSEDILQFRIQSGIFGSWNKESGTLTLIGRSSVSNYRSALRSVQYQNTNSLNPSENPRRVSFTVNDGLNSSNTVSRDIVFTMKDKPPELINIESVPLGYCINSGSKILTSTLTILDDNAGISSAKVQIIAGFAAGDLLHFTDQNGITGSWDNFTGLLSLSGIGTVATYQSAIRSIGFETTGGFGETRTISIVVNDGLNFSNTASRIILIGGSVKAVLTGNASLCNDGVSTANLQISFTGTPPWAVTLSRNSSDERVYSGITQNPFNINVKEDGIYRVKSVSDATCPGDTAGSGVATVIYRASPTAAISGVDTSCSGETAELKVTLTGTGPWKLNYFLNGLTQTPINNILSPEYALIVTSAGNYTLSSVEDATCTGKVSGNGLVQQFTAPTAVISGDATICEGGVANVKVDLTGAAPWKYSYKKNDEASVSVSNVFINPSIFSANRPGTYMLTEIRDRNCKGTVSGSARIFQAPTPAVSISGLEPAYVVSTVKVLLFGNPEGGRFGNNPAIINPPPPEAPFFAPIVAGVGTHTITYSYQSPTTGCYGYDTAIVKVLLTSAAIEYRSNRDKYCSNEKAFVVEATNLTNTIGSFSINGGKGLEDHHNNTATINPSVLGSGTYTITYFYFDDKPLNVQSTFQVIDKPVADFSWENECFHTGKAISFRDNSVAGQGEIVGYKWKLGKANGYDSLAAKNIGYLFTEAGNHDISLQVLTSLGCSDVIHKTFPLRPAYALDTTGYFEDFEQSPPGWRSDSSASSSVNSWTLGDPSKGFIDESPSIAWYTYIPVSSAYPIEQSRVTSPCFDFTGMQKPMLKLSVWRQFNALRDGAVVQATTDYGKSWQNVGDISDGINWYNSSNITGNPGGQDIGWSNIQDAQWVESKHDLDMFRDKKDVQFRIAYGSDGTALNNNGIAFDNFTIRERSRNVIIEHFTNSSDADSKNANLGLNNLVAGNHYIIDLQYHTAFPGPDPFNEDAPYIPAVRVLYYGLVDVPFSVLNGGAKSTNLFDYGANPLVEKPAIIESLDDNRFSIGLNSKITDNSLRTMVRLTSLGNMPIRELTMHVVVMERQVSGITGNNGETEFRNVVKTMLPDAAGTTYYRDWLTGDTDTVTFTWNLEDNVYNPSEIRIVSFIQDESTREIYQAFMDTIGVSIGTDVPQPEKPPADEILLYPNPSSGYVYVKFQSFLKAGARIEIYNNLGEIIYEDRLNAGKDLFAIDMHPYSAGLYTVRIIMPDNTQGIKKLIRVK